MCMHVTKREATPRSCLDSGPGACFSNKDEGWMHMVKSRPPGVQIVIQWEICN